MGIIRILLALFVVAFHCGDFYSKTMPGPIAVESFYIISGFYMALILNEKFRGRGSYSLFITNRVLRLYPVYWTVLGLIISTTIIFYLFSGGRIFSGLIPIHIIHPSMNLFTIGYVILTNLFLVGQDVIMFLGLNLETGHLFFTRNFALTDPQMHSFLLVPQAWTIGIEITFYLIAPLIARRSLKVLIPLFLLSFLTKIILYRNGLNYDPWTYRFFPAEMMFFLLGIFSYRLYTVLNKLRIHRFILRFVFLSVLGVLIFYPYLHYYIRTYLYFVGFFLALPVVFIYTKSSSFDRLIGEYSYPVYISHVFVKNLFAFTFRVPLNLSVTTSAGSVFLSYFLYNFVSKKIEFIRQKRVLANNERIRREQSQMAIESSG